MNLGSSRFWAGILIGSVVGAMAYRCSQTEKAKKWKEDLYSTMRQMRDKAQCSIEEAKKRAVEAGVKAVDNIAEKAKETKEKVHSLSRDYEG